MIARRGRVGEVFLDIHQEQSIPAELAHSYSHDEEGGPADCALAKIIFPRYFSELAAVMASSTGTPRRSLP